MVSGQYAMCDCGLNRTCSVDFNRCNCDLRSRRWQHDSGILRDKSQVPITDIYAERYGSIPDGVGTVTLGPLRCWGDRVHQEIKAITFKTAESYVRSPGWTYEDLRLSFRTFNTQAVLVYQHNNNGSYLSLTLHNGTSIRFLAKLGNNLTEVWLSSPSRVDDGQWHIVRLEHDNYNLRLTFGMRSDLRKVTARLLDVFPAQVNMYIGGAPPGVSALSGVPGLSGCIRDLVYNNQIVSLDLPGIHKVGRVYPGCTAECVAAPCQNGGTCEELWGNYNCHCVNTLSHLGYNCENNIDEDMVTFSGKSDSYLYFDQSASPRVLDSSILLSFRTRASHGLLLYLHDNYNNFVQLELRNDRQVALTYNSFSDVKTAVLRLPAAPGASSPSYLNDGQWHQVYVEKLNHTYQIRMGQAAVKVFHLRLKKQMEPFNTPVSVQPPAPSASPRFVRMYVGGVPYRKNDLSNLEGCIRGLRIGKAVFNLGKASLGNTAVKKKCKAGCTAGGAPICYNDGDCVNMWGDGDTFCDCTVSQYTGQYCTLEPCAEFHGDTVLLYKFESNTYGATRTDKESVEVSFSTNVTGSGKYVLVDIYSTKGHSDVTPRSLCDVTPRSLCDVTPRSLCDVTPRSLCDVTPRSLCDVTPRSLCDVTPRSLCDVTPRSLCDVTPRSL
ncbi:hypothetical protein Ahia01_001396700 [Argonauta hians]